MWTSCDIYLGVWKPAAISGIPNGSDISKRMFKDRKWMKEWLFLKGERFDDFLEFPGDWIMFYLVLTYFQILNSNACGDQYYDEL